jgi:hypothetical protein
VHPYFHTELARARMQDAHAAAARHRLASVSRRRHRGEPDPVQQRLIGRSVRARSQSPAPSFGLFASSWSNLDPTTSN